MPISPISTSLIHNHAPVLENAANSKNAWKLHFAGVSANNENQSYFIGAFLQTTPIVQKFSTVLIGLVQLIRACALPVIYFLVNTIYSTTVNPIYSTIHIIPTQDTVIFNTIISILQYCYSYVIHCNYIVTIIISITYSYIYRYNISIKIYNNQYRYKHTD